MIRRFGPRAGIGLVVAAVIALGGFIGLRAAVDGPIGASPTPGASAGPVQTVGPPRTARPVSTDPIPAGTEIRARVGDCEALPTPETALDCHIRALGELMAPMDDPRPLVAAVAEVAAEVRGAFQSSCHSVMHPPESMGMEKSATPSR